MAAKRAAHLLLRRRLEKGFKIPECLSLTRIGTSSGTGSQVCLVTV